MWLRKSSFVNSLCVRKRSHNHAYNIQIHTHTKNMYTQTCTHTYKHTRKICTHKHTICTHTYKHTQTHSSHFFDNLLNIVSFKSSSKTHVYETSICKHVDTHTTCTLTHTDTHTYMQTITTCVMFDALKWMCANGYGLVNWVNFCSFVAHVNFMRKTVSRTRILKYAHKLVREKRIHTHTQCAHIHTNTHKCTFPNYVLRANCCFTHCVSVKCNCYAVLTQIVLKTHTDEYTHISGTWNTHNYVNT